MSALHTVINDAIEIGAAGYRPAPETDGLVDQNVVQISLISLDQIDEALRAEWRELSDATGAPNPNFAPGFLEPAMRHLDPSREVMLGLLRWGKDKLLVGLAPLVLSKSYIKLPLKHLRIWTHQHCHNGAPMIREGYEVVVYSGLFDWIDTRPRGAGFIRFPRLALDRRTYLAMEEACDLRDRSFRVPGVTAHDLLTAEDNSEADVPDFCMCLNHPLAARMGGGRSPIVNINVPANSFAGKTLLETAEVFEGIKDKTLKRLNS